jgi:hypothetical protein
MRRLLFAAAGPLLLAGAVLSWSLGGGSTPAHALTNCSTSTQALDAAEQELLRLINEFRAQNGVAPLKPSPNLSRAAAWMSEDMAAKGYFDHTDSLGRSPFQRVRDCGYASSGAGENLAIAGSAQQAFNLFVNSPYGHRENMLRAMWVVAGIGRAGGYWSVVFGNVDDSGQAWDTQPPPQPSPTPTPTRPPASPSPPPSGGSPTLPPGSGGPQATPTMAPTATPTAVGGGAQPSSNPFLPRRAIAPNVTAEG